MKGLELNLSKSERSSACTCEANTTRRRGDCDFSNAELFSDKSEETNKARHGRLEQGFESSPKRNKAGGRTSEGFSPQNNESILQIALNVGELITDVKNLKTSQNKIEKRLNTLEARIEKRFNETDDKLEKRFDDFKTTLSEFSAHLSASNERRERSERMKNILRKAATEAFGFFSKTKVFRLIVYGAIIVGFTKVTEWFGLGDHAEKIWELIKHFLAM